MDFPTNCWRFIQRSKRICISALCCCWYENGCWYCHFVQVSCKLSLHCRYRQAQNVWFFLQSVQICFIRALIVSFWNFMLIFRIAKCYYNYIVSLPNEVRYLWSSVGWLGFFGLSAIISSIKSTQVLKADRNQALLLASRPLLLSIQQLCGQTPEKRHLFRLWYGILCPLNHC